MINIVFYSDKPTTYLLGNLLKINNYTNKQLCGKNLIDGTQLPIKHVTYCLLVSCLYALDINADRRQVIMNGQAAPTLIIYNNRCLV